MVLRYGDILVLPNDENRYLIHHVQTLGPEPRVFLVEMGGDEHMLVGLDWLRENSQVKGNLFDLPLGDVPLRSEAVQRDGE